ncbi:DgyrCDS14858 [Dimorphilus gyrociliatus]|nr:DgyrCDS14858 [Dimorphilus gyrociliatus]
MSSSSIVSPLAGEHCNGSKLHFVTPNNKKLFHKFINQLNPLGTTNYIDAFNTTFSLFSSSPTPKVSNIGTREKLIIFLTYTTPHSDISTVEQFFKQSNLHLSNSIPIFTYAIGNNFHNKTLTFLKEVSTQKFENTKNTPTSRQQGMFKHVLNATDLKSELAIYYKYLESSSQNRETLITSPVYDKSQGVLVSLCSPIWIYGFIGVARIDVSFSDIFSDIETFTSSQLSSYPMVIDSMNRALSHPLLPSSIHIFNDLTYLTFNLLEPQLSSSQIHQMISSKEGSFAAVTQRIKSRGNSLYEGIDVDSVASNYYWIMTKEFGYKICFVVTEKDYLLDVEYKFSDYPFDYHKIRLGCPYRGTVILRNTSTTKLAPESFVDPFEYLNTFESYSRVQSYKNVINGHTENSLFKNQIIPSFGISDRLDKIWSQLDNNYQTPYNFKFFGSKTGLFKSLPGFELPNIFSPTHQPWYKKSMFYKGKIVISPIQRDNINVNWVNTLSHVVYEGRRNRQHTADDNTLGVVGLEVNMGYFYYTIVKLVPKCQLDQYSCLMIDESGLMISYQRGAKNPNSISHYQHIISLEPRLSTQLVSAEILQKSQCFNILTFRYQLYWRVTFKNDKYQGKFFTIQRIRNTNALLIIIDRNEEKSYENHCSVCQPEMADCLRNVECQCPCYIPKEINSCQSAQKDNTPICAVEVLRNFTSNSNAATGLCGRKPECLGNTKEGCKKLKHCTWCYTKYHQKTILRELNCVIPVKCKKFLRKGGSSSIWGGISGGIAVGSVFITCNICNFIKGYMEDIVWRPSLDKPPQNLP